MKNILFVSALLLSAVAYSQDNLIATGDSVSNENQLSYQLNEVVISDVKEILLGELDAKSKKWRSMSSGDKLAYYFENSVPGEGVFLKAFLFKVQEVKYRTEAHIRLYEKKDYMQDIYIETGTTSYASFIPGEQIQTKDIVIYIEPDQKGIVEVDLSKYGIAMPAEGLFVSLEGGGYYDANGNAVTDVKPKDITYIGFHPSVTDNYCDWITTEGTNSSFWMNINKWTKADFKYAFKKEPSKKILKAPNFGLKVGRK